MRKLICNSYEELSSIGAYIIAEQIRCKSVSKIGFATGSTPIGTYKELRKMYENGDLDMSTVISFNLDEYYPISRDNPQSYYTFMKENLFDHVNISKQNINIPNGECTDPHKECIEYDELIKDYEGTDLQILGIGNNGHIGFNEPADILPYTTNLVTLKQDTINANARFFDSIDDVPKQAITMGMGGIFTSKHILLLISGEGKAEITKKLFSNDISTQVPASLLKLHSNVTVLLDKEAAKLL